MVKVAVAGGSGHLGLHIVEAIVASKRHSIVVLSRSSSHPALEALGVPVSKVDYDDHSSLVSALEGVHTVISSLASVDDSFTTSQLALLRAAVEAKVKRFAPSEFSVESLPGDIVSLYSLKLPVIQAVAKSGLEWTIFETGMFMNYFAMGTKGVGHLRPLPWIVDVPNGTARVPNDGNQKLTFTEVEDVGAFVAASLDLEQWPTRSGMAGDIKTYNEVISLAEKVTGKKFQVTYVTEETLRAEMDPNPPSKFTNMYQEALISIGYHDSRFRYETNLNSLCPEVKPVRVEEFMRKWWGNAQG